MQRATPINLCHCESRVYYAGSVVKAATVLFTRRASHSDSSLASLSFSVSMNPLVVAGHSSRSDNHWGPCCHKFDATALTEPPRDARSAGLTLAMPGQWHLRIPSFFVVSWMTDARFHTHAFHRCESHLIQRRTVVLSDHAVISETCKRSDDKMNCK